jgi:MSHA biogenesis protein MshJ
MQARWESLLAWFDALSARERVLVVLALFAIAYQLTYHTVLQPQQQQVEAFHRAIAADNAAIQALGTEMRMLASLAERDPNAELRQHIAGLRDAIARQEQQLAQAASGMITPQEMVRFLERLLSAEDELTLLGLRSLEPQPLLPAKPGDDAVAEGLQTPLHRHDFVIAFSGGYLPTLRYLESIEQLPWQFFWDSVSFEVVDYPRSIVRLQLYTLSLSEDWIGV